MPKKSLFATLATLKNARKKKSNATSSSTPSSSSAPQDSIGRLFKSALIGKHKNKKAGLMKIYGKKIFRPSATCNDYYIVSEEIGKGAFGCVYKINEKITIQQIDDKGKPDFKLTRTPASCVLKQQTLTAHDEAEERNRMQEEFRYLRQTPVKNTAYLESGKHVFILMDNFGFSLDKVIQSEAFKSWGFAQRMVLAMGIVEELLRLEALKIIHRDIKPANICVDIINHGNNIAIQVAVVDFGLANIDDYAGTPAYLAPEVVDKQPHELTSAVDRWALGPILAEILGERFETLLQPPQDQAPDPFRDLVRALNGPYLPYMSGYNYAQLAPNMARRFPRVEPIILKDLVCIIKELQNNNPKKRPSAELLLKFFTLLPQRAKLFAQANDPAKRQSTKQLLLRQRSRAQALKRQCDCAGLQTTLGNTITRINNTLQSIAKPAEAQSHYEISQHMHANNLTSAHYPAVFPDYDAQLQSISSDMTQVKTAQQMLNARIPRILAMITSDTFQGTNSSGIRTMRKHLNNPNNKEPLPNLHAVVAIARQKTKHNFSNWRSKASFFGHGRNINVDHLYHLLAKIDLNAGNANIANQLKQTEDFLTNKRLCFVGPFCYNQLAADPIATLRI